MGHILMQMMRMAYRNGDILLSISPKRLRLVCAAICLDEGEGESSWNLDVHAPLLSWVFRQKRSRLVDYRYWYVSGPFQLGSHFS